MRIVRKSVTFFIISFFAMGVAFGKLNNLENNHGAVQRDNVSEEIVNKVSSLGERFDETDNYLTKKEILEELSRIAHNYETDSNVIQKIRSKDMLLMAMRIAINPTEDLIIRSKMFELIGIAKDSNVIKELLMFIEKESDELETNIVSFDSFSMAIFALLSCALDDIPYSYIKSNAISYLAYLASDLFINREVLKSMGAEVELKDIEEPFKLELMGFKRLKNMFPHLPITYRLLGYCYNAKNDFDSSIEVYKELVALDPQTKYRKNLAINYMRKGDFNKAIQELETRIKIDSGDLEAYRILAHIFLETNQFSRAESICRRGLKINGLDNGLHMIVAQSLSGLKKYGEAIKEARKAIEIMSVDIEGIKKEGDRLTADYSLAGPFMHAFTPGVAKKLFEFLTYHYILTDCYYLNEDYGSAKETLEFIIKNSSSGFGIKEKAQNYLQKVNERIKETQEGLKDEKDLH